MLNCLGVALILPAEQLSLPRI